MVETITLRNRLHLLQRLIVEEVLHKRETNLKAFQRGLDVLGVLDLIKQPEVMRSAFLYDPLLLTVMKFLELLLPHSNPPDAQQIFKDFVSFLEYIYNIIIYIM